MGIIDKLADMATESLDQSGTNLFGGKLAKAELVWYKGPGIKDELGRMSFFINPSKISISKEVKFEKDESNQATATNKYGYTLPVCMELGEMWFDTYDERNSDKIEVRSVRKKYIDKLEELLDYNPNTHYVPVCTFVWGEFTQKSEKMVEYAFYVAKLDVTYTMFLPDGTPVRAQVKMKLEQALEKDKEIEKRDKKSPDHAKLYTVRRGDTLQGIAMKEYDNPGEWRRIAETNQIDDPMVLVPGRKLLVPPIIK